MTIRGKFQINPLLTAAILAIAAVILSLVVGSVPIPLITLGKMILGKLPGIQIQPSWPAPFSTILFDLRFPRTVLIALTGASLAGSGAAYQGLFRNPLADPYLIGVASGAGLGAVIAMSIHWPATMFGFFTIPFAAFLSGMLTVMLVYILARVGKTVPTTNLLLAGVSISSFCTALTSYLMIQSQSELRRAIIWLLGGSSMTGWEPVLAMLPYTIVGLGALLISGNPLNVLQFGEEQASQLGLNVQKARVIVILGSSLAAASAVAFTGIIGFVGLIVPHIVRILWSGDYRRLIPLSIVTGVTVLLVTDIIARIIIPPQEVPLGIITALVGAPFFLWVLKKSKQQAFW
jgi:iron complex transport system permease protein